MDGLKLLIKGNYNNTDGNNYYFLNVEEIIDELNNNEKLDVPNGLTFELITLNKKQIIDDNDREIEFLSVANCAIFNNRDLTFNAIMYHSPQRINQCFILESDIITEIIEKINLCKLIQI